MKNQWQQLEHPKDKTHIFMDYAPPKLLWGMHDNDLEAFPMDKLSSAPQEYMMAGFSIPVESGEALTEVIKESLTHAFLDKRRKRDAPKNDWLILCEWTCGPGDAMRFVGVFGAGLLNLTTECITIAKKIQTADQLNCSQVEFSASDLIGKGFLIHAKLWARPDGDVGQVSLAAKKAVISAASPTTMAKIHLGLGLTQEWHQQWMHVIEEIAALDEAKVLQDLVHPKRATLVDEKIPLKSNAPSL